MPTTLFLLLKVTSHSQLTITIYPLLDGEISMIIHFYVYRVLQLNSWLKLLQHKNITSARAEEISYHFSSLAATCSAIAILEVRPGDSIPNRFTKPDIPWMSSPCKTCVLETIRFSQMDGKGNQKCLCFR